MRRRHHYNLAVIGRIGESLLVASHSSLKDRFTEGATYSAIGLALEYSSIIQD
jgi:hypothetical protein